MDMLKAKETMPWARPSGELSSSNSVIGKLAESVLDGPEKLAEDRAAQRVAELESDEDGEFEEGDCESDDGSSSEALCASLVFGSASAVLGMEIGGQQPSIVGMAMLVLVALSSTNSLASPWTVPVVVAPRYMLRLCIPHIVTMLRHSRISVTDCAVELLSHLVWSIPERAKRPHGGDQFRVKNGSGPPKDLLALSLSCISFVVACPDPARQARAWRVFSRCVSTLHPETRFSLLASLIGKCPHNNVVGMLVDMAGSTVVLPATPMHRQAETSQAKSGGSVNSSRVRNGPDLVALIWRVWSRAKEADDVLEVAEVYMSLLSVLRRILLCDDPVRNDFALWPSIGTVKKAYVTELRSQVRAKIEAREYDIERLGTSTQAQESKREMGGDVARLQMIDHIASLLLEVVSEKQIMREEGGL